MRDSDPDSPSSEAHHCASADKPFAGIAPQVLLEASMPAGVKPNERLSWFSPTGTLVHLDVDGSHASPGDFLEFAVPERLLKEPKQSSQQFALMAFDVPASWTENRCLATTLPSGLRARIIPPPGTLPGDQLVFFVARWQLEEAQGHVASHPTEIETKAVLNRLLVDARRVRHYESDHRTSDGVRDAPDISPRPKSRQHRLGLTQHQAKQIGCCHSAE